MKTRDILDNVSGAVKLTNTPVNRSNVGSTLRMLFNQASIDQRQVNLLKTNGFLALVIYEAWQESSRIEVGDNLSPDDIEKALNEIF